MQRASTAPKLAMLATAGLLAAGAAHAQAADDAVIFDNAIDPAAAEQIIASSDIGTATLTLSAVWQTALALHQDAISGGATAEDVASLQAAAEAAGAAYEAALVIQNSEELAASAPVILTDEVFAELVAE